MDRAYEELANAIILQAVHDIRMGNKYARSAVVFLKSEWCNVLSNVDGNFILKKLQQETGKKQIRRKRKVVANG